MAFIDINSSFIDHILRLIHGLQDGLLPAVFDLLLGILSIRLLVRGVTKIPSNKSNSAGRKPSCKPWIRRRMWSIKLEFSSSASLSVACGCSSSSPTSKPAKEADDEN